jgi:putative metallohydrolase (TIGR04338 family)
MGCGRADCSAAGSRDTVCVPDPSTSRDSRRGRVYSAEQQVARLLDRATGAASTVDFFGSTLTLPVERRFADLASVQRWVDAVLALDEVRTRWGDVPGCGVRCRRGASRAHYEPPGTIAVPPAGWAMRELMLCHELAHHLTFHASGGAENPGHGRLFVDAYVSLTGVVIGPEVALLLRAGLDQVGAV